MAGKNDGQLNGGSQGIVRIGERIASLLALSLVTGKPQAEQIGLLSGAGYTPTEIARLLGTTANTVSVTLHQMKRGKSRRK